MRTPKESIRWRIVLICFTLVFVAMTIVSLYQINRTRDYQLSSLQQNIDSTVSESNLLDSLGRFEDLSESAPEIRAYISDNFAWSDSQEISVVDGDLVIIASTNDSLPGRNASSVFNAGLVTRVLAEGRSAQAGISERESGVLSVCYPVLSEAGKATGAVMVRADLTSIENFAAQSRIIFAQAMLIVLAVTVILSLILSSTITRPINSVSEAAEKISDGDFSTQVPVKSNDEIGQLAQVFNMMQGRLGETMSEIQGEKSKLETILKSMADGLIAVSLSGELIHVNEAARHMLKVSEDAELSEFTYDSLLGHLSPELEFSKLVRNSLEGETETSFDYGGYIFAVRYDRFTSDDNVGIVILIQDITARQKFEDMQTDFVANVSHELKTPIATVKAYTETLMDGGVDEDTTYHFLGIINSEADRMNRLVKDLLQLSRLDHKQEKLSIKEGNINLLLTSCTEKMAPVAAQKDISINMLYDDDADLRVLYDKDRMEQVIMNILSNSVKYTEKGGRIDVDCYRERKRAKIVISDTGIGIPEDKLPRIFERFYRVDKARSRSMGSSGLGLSISKHIVEEHNGTIEVESKLGEGTTMIIRLPLAYSRGVPNIE